MFKLLVFGEKSGKIDSSGVLVMGNTNRKVERRKGIKSMKKNIFKKIVATLATAAMAVGMFAAMPATEAKAADELYVIGDFCGWSWDNSATLTSSDGNVYKGDIEVSADSDIVINTAKNWDGGDANKMTYKYGDYTGVQTKVTFASAGKYTLTYNKTSQVLDIAAKSTITVNWTYKYVVAGDPKMGAADWAGDVAALTAGVMTESNGKYTLTVTPDAAGEYEFKIVKVGTPDVASVDKSADWIGDPDNGGANFKATLVAGKNTITFDASTNKVTVAKATDDTTQPTTTTKTEGATTTTNNSTVDPSDTADSSAVVIMLAVAAVAAGAVVVSRKKAVNE